MTLSTQPSAANGTAATVVVPGAITVESDGVCSSTCKVLVGGTVVPSLSINNGDSFGCGLTRYSSNGNIDATFGQAGAASASFTPTEPDATLFALALQSNGDIVAAGTAGQPGANPAFVTQADFALSRFTSSCKADSSFGSAGNVTTSFGSNEAAIYALAIQKDGKIVAVGSSLSSVNPGSIAGGRVVARYLAQ